MEMTKASSNSTRTLADSPPELKLEIAEEPRLPLRVCVLGLGGGGFHSETKNILDEIQRPLELILVHAGPSGGIVSEENRPTGTPVAEYYVRTPRLMGDSWFTSFRVFLGNLLSAWRILTKERPHVVFAVGTAQAIPFGFVARLLGTPLFFCESLTRVKKPSRTATWVHRLRLAHKFFYPWPELGRYFPRGKCAWNNVSE